MNQEQHLQRAMAMAKSGGVCEVCGKPLVHPQGAHRIANTKANRARWGSFVIDSPENIAMVCSLKCNDKCNIGMDTGKCVRLAKTVFDKAVQRYE